MGKSGEWSLKTKVTLLTLVIFLTTLWLLTFWASRLMREDLQKDMESQQFSTVSLLAGILDTTFREQMNGLELVAKTFNPALLQDRQAAQNYLEERMVLNSMFNHGIWIADRTGTAIASVGGPASRLGTNYGDRDFLVAALKEGRPAIGRPVRGRVDKQVALFAMAVPLRDAQGAVVGALCGVINLGLPSFLDSITENRYGKTGAYLLVDGGSRTVVTASDREVVMSELPPPGANPAIDRFMTGYEGSQILQTPYGESVLASAKTLPTPGWYLIARQSVTEAFAAIESVRRRIFFVGVLLSVLAGVMTWWVLHRHLSSLGRIADRLTRMANTETALEPLPVEGHSEISVVVRGVNHLLNVLAQRESSLREQTAQRETAQAQAYQADVLLRNAVETLEHGVAVFDAEDRLVICNEAYKRFLPPGRPIEYGQTYESMLRQRIVNGYYPEGGPAAEAWIAARLTAHVQANGKPVEVPLGGDRWMLAFDHRTDNGHTVCSRFDITDIKRTESELRLARDEAEKANRAKTDFLSSMSHELRTPLNAVLGFAQLLTDDPGLPADARDSAREIENAGKILLGLITEILDLSRIESGQMELAVERVPLQPVIERSFRLVGRLAEGAGVQLIDDGGDGQDASVDVDPARLQQVVLNFLSNAIKYNRPGGSVRLSYLCRNDEGRPVVRISVADTGCGIPAEKQARVFGAFDRLGRENGTIEGTGIGLMITRRIVEAMGGTVGFSSVENEGSTFWAEFPVATEA